MTSIDPATATEELRPIQSVGTTRIVHEFADLVELHDSECSSVVLRAGGVQGLGEGDRTRLIESMRHPVHGEVGGDGEGIERLAQSLDKLGCSPGVAAFLSHWTEVVCELTGASSCGVRLARLSEQMCPLFHTDRVTVRLLVTWDGVTTELATAPGYSELIAERPELKETGDQGQVFRPENGDMVLMKGELWPGLRHGAAVHRSPVVPGESTRLMCTWDPLG